MRIRFVNPVQARSTVTVSAFDPLSDLLQSARVDAALFINVEFTAPWCVVPRFGLSSVAQRLGRAERVMHFYHLVEGRCRLQREGTGDALDLEAGDCLFFANGERHRLGSDLHIAPVEAASLDADAAGHGDAVHVRHGGGGAATRFICGYFALQEGAHGCVLGALPDVLRVPGRGLLPATLPRDLLRLAVRESFAARPGARSTLTRVSELLFAGALRSYFERVGSASEASTRMAALQDSRVGHALDLLHREPGHPWTLETLARDAALSRSSLAERFAALVGQSPMQYLSRLRLARAAQALRLGGESINRVAERHGYGSDAAFSRAFKRQFGLAPSLWRQAGRRAGALKTTSD